jgi:hypothetical protein
MGATTSAAVVGVVVVVGPWLYMKSAPTQVHEISSHSNPAMTTSTALQKNILLDTTYSWTKNKNDFLIVLSQRNIGQKPN